MATFKCINFPKYLPLVSSQALGILLYFSACDLLPADIWVSLSFHEPWCLPLPSAAPKLPFKACCHYSVNSGLGCTETIPLGSAQTGKDIASKFHSFSEGGNWELGCPLLTSLHHAREKVG